MGKRYYRDPRLGPPKHGEKLNIGRMSKRTLESWAAHYDVLHLAEDLPVDQRAMKYQHLLLDIQRSRPGALVVGQKMTRVPMGQSQWPNKKYKEKMRKMSEAVKKEEDEDEDDKHMIRSGGWPSRSFPTKEEDEEKKFQIKEENDG
ncbi:hypothetical protein V5O48_004331 [Marasmius crinis-equi]|uniref:Uncharacterized protein n=1 Tax=Marasmius crinis-equi TaxID=585013 RepID=A0ABR3FQD2_9AGAR